jgi:hypothetical protein
MATTKDTKRTEAGRVSYRGESFSGFNKPKRTSGGNKKFAVNKAGNYTKPTMRKSLFNKIKAGGKGGKPGQWSARKAQMLAKEYKAKGGGYKD